MKEQINKLTEIRNWIGKGFLLILGMFLLLAVFYRDGLEMFMLTDKKAPDWSNTHYIFLSTGSAFVIGGVYLNNILDGVSAGFKNLMNRFTK